MKIFSCGKPKLIQSDVTKETVVSVQKETLKQRTQCSTFKKWVISICIECEEWEQFDVSVWRKQTLLQNLVIIVMNTVPLAFLPEATVFLLILYGVLLFFCYLVLYMCQEMCCVSVVVAAQNKEKLECSTNQLHTTQPVAQKFEPSIQVV